MQSLFVINQHNIVVADIIRPRGLHNFIDIRSVVCVELSQLTSYKAIEYVRTVNLKF